MNILISFLRSRLDSIILLISISGIVASPQRRVRDAKESKLVGQATNLLATKVLKGGVDNEKNFVFSPFGLSTILTILGEGAADETANDIDTFFKYPSDREMIRSCYKKLLEPFQGSEPHQVPQFRTWFYIYKNNTVENEYRKLIEDNYFVSVKEIERDYVDTEATTAAKKTEEPATVAPVLLKNLESGKNNSKDIVEFDEVKADSDSPADESRIDDQKDSSKFDEVVEDRQYADKDEINGPANESEANAVDVNLADEKILKASMEDPKEIVDEEKTVKKEKVDSKESDAPEKFSLPLKQFDEMEIMQAQESRLAKAFAGMNDGDGTSIISGNSIVGEKKELAADAKEDEKFESKMLLFNGLYYRGNWQTPFQVIHFIFSVFAVTKQNFSSFSALARRGIRKSLPHF